VLCTEVAKHWCDCLRVASCWCSNWSELHGELELTAVCASFFSLWKTACCKAWCRSTSVVGSHLYKVSRGLYGFYSCRVCIEVWIVDGYAKLCSWSYDIWCHRYGACVCIN